MKFLRHGPGQESHLDPLIPPLSSVQLPLAGRCFAGCAHWIYKTD